MTQPTQRSFLAAPWLIAPVAFLALTACGPKDDSRTAGQKLDSAIAKTEQKTDEMKADASRKMDQAKDSMSSATQDAKSSASDMGDKMGAAMSDASITTAVNAELAKDSKLSALKINVDTNNGNVKLTGSAPDSASLNRATTLASNVKGVVHVDNQLTVTGS